MPRASSVFGLGIAITAAVAYGSVTPSAEAASDRTVVVRNADELESAVQRAHPGQVIELAPGDYGRVLIQNTKFDGPVTITSQFAQHQAVLRGLVVAFSNDLNLSDLEFDATGLHDNNPFLILNSSNISLDHLNVHGSLDGNPKDDVALMLIRNSNDVHVTNSEFQQGLDGIGHLDNDDLLISGNNIHDIRNDAIRGGGSSHITISNNTITNFYPEPGDHDDGIQFWTTNTKTSAHDIIITGNNISRGKGVSAFQGIFLGNELKLPYQHVVVANNTVGGAGYTGLGITIASDVEVRGNTVQPYKDQRSWILLRNVKDAVVADNRSPEYGYVAPDHVKEDHNIKIAPIDIPK